MAKYLHVFDSVANAFKLMLGAQSSAGVADAGKIVALNASGQIDNTMLPSSSLDSAIASEAISAGDAVNVWDNVGTRNVRKADNTNGRRCDGFAATSAAASASCTFDTDGGRTAVTGVVLASTYYLGAAGAIVTTPTTTVGHQLQKVGTGAGTGILTIEIEVPATFE